MARGENRVRRIVDGRVLRDAVLRADARGNVDEQTLRDGPGRRMSPAMIILIIAELGPNRPGLAESVPAGRAALPTFRADDDDAIRGVRAVERGGGGSLDHIHRFDLGHREIAEPRRGL